MHFAERWMQALWETKLRCYIICAAFVILGAWNLLSGSFSLTKENLLSLALCAVVAVYALYRASKAER